jgi:hypothetical protein
VPDRARPPFDVEELERIATALGQRVKDGSMPPGDAYWWTRIIYRAARDAGALNDAEHERDL